LNEGKVFTEVTDDKGTSYEQIKRQAEDRCF